MDTKDKPAESTEQKDATPAAADSSPEVIDATTDNSASGSTTKSDKTDDSGKDSTPAPPSNSFKQTLKRIRVYLIAVLLLITIGGVFLTVSALNSRKTPPPPNIQSQTLTQNQLKQSAGATGTATSGQTLTIQGNATLDGQAQVHNSLYVAGDVQSAAGFSAPQLTVSGTGSIGSAQTGALQVATTATFQGLVTLQKDLNLSGNASLSTASVTTLTATNIIMSDNGQIKVPGHLALMTVVPGDPPIAGAFPGRSVSFGVLGNGGSASVNGSDTSGTVNINTGNNPVAGCFVSLTFVVPFTHVPNILLGPIGFGAGAITHYVRPTTNAAGTTTGFRICTNDTPVPNQAFGFSYLVTN